MKTMRWLAATLLVVGVMGVVLYGSARAADKDKGDAVKADPQEVADAKLRAKMLKTLARASELAEFGEKHKTPEAVIAAASLIRYVNFQTGGKFDKLDVPVEDEKGKKINVPAEKEKSLKEQAEDLFDTASGIGGPGVEALIKAAKKREYKKERGAAGGAKRICRSVSAGSTHRYTIPFQPNKPAGVYLQSNHPVRIVVTQPGIGPVMNTIVKTASYTWVPRGKGNVRITITVTGTDRIGKYTLSTN